MSDSHLGSVTVIESHGEALSSNDAFKGARGRLFCASWLMPKKIGGKDD